VIALFAIPAIASAAPVNTSLPQAVPSGPRQGVTETAKPGAWSQKGTFTYQWKRCVVAKKETCENIAGATLVEYTPTVGDVGRFLRVTVTDTNSEGSGEATSEPTGEVASSSAPATWRVGGKTLAQLGVSEVSFAASSTVPWTYKSSSNGLEIECSSNSATGKISGTGGGTATVSSSGCKISGNPKCSIAASPFSAKIELALIGSTVYEKFLPAGEGPMEFDFTSCGYTKVPLTGGFATKVPIENNALVLDTSMNPTVEGTAGVNFWWSSESVFLTGVFNQSVTGAFEGSKLGAW
jgi:hypothetical protein